MNVTLYSTHCPKCKVLEMKLEKAHIVYETVADTDIMISKGFKSVPMLEVDGKVMNFKEAIDWVKERVN